MDLEAVDLLALLPFDRPTIQRMCQIQAISRSTKMAGPKISTLMASGAHSRRFGRTRSGTSSSAGSTAGSP